MSRSTPDLFRGSMRHLMRDYGALQFLVSLFVVVSIAVIAPITLKTQVKSPNSMTDSETVSTEPLTVDGRVRVLQQLEAETAQSGVPVPSIEDRLRALEALEKVSPATQQDVASTSPDRVKKIPGTI